MSAQKKTPSPILFKLRSSFSSLFTLMTPSFLQSSPSNSSRDRLATANTLPSFTDLLFLKVSEQVPFFEIADYQTDIHYPLFLQFMAVPSLKSTSALCEQFIQEINEENLSVIEISKAYKKFMLIVLRRLAKPSTTANWQEYFSQFAIVALCLEKYLLSNIYTKYFSQNIFSCF